MKITIIIGTRPEIIKMSPIINECRQLNLDYRLLHTGQHYSYNMDSVFFEQLKLPQPDYNLNIGSASHALQTGKILIEVEKILHKEKPDIILVEGDTNTVLAGALAAVKLHIRVGHVEAGLRSYDKHMPEEINRILTDHCSDFLFAPTKESEKNLLKEGIIDKKIFVTGNTIVDSVLENIEISNNSTNIMNELGLKREEYFLVTTHRQENVDYLNKFSNILNALKKLHNLYNIPIIYPIHPRAIKNMKNFNLNFKDINIIDPIDYLSFLQLEKNAKIVLTDSGGVQEETCILGTPCVTLRDNTERHETVNIGSNILAGTKPENIIKCVSRMYDKSKIWKNPYGDGKSGKKIVKIIRECL